MLELHATSENHDHTNIFAAFNQEILNYIQTNIKPTAIQDIIHSSRDAVLHFCREKAHEYIALAIQRDHLAVAALQQQLEKPENQFIRQILSSIPAKVDNPQPLSIDTFLAAAYYTALYPTDESKTPLFSTIEEEQSFLAKHAYELQMLDPTNLFATELINQIEGLKQEVTLQKEISGANDELDLNALAQKAAAITFDQIYVAPMDTANADVKNARVKPMHAHQEQTTIIHDTMKNNSVTIITSREWRDNGMPRDKLLCVTEFDYSTLGLDVGRAGFLLVGPTTIDDVRIELKSQNSQGTAGDKLPTAMRRLSNASRVRAYGKVIVGVLGGPLFSKEALEMAREEAARNNRVQLVEGLENLQDALNEEISAVRGKHLLTQLQAQPSHITDIDVLDRSQP